MAQVAVPAWYRPREYIHFDEPVGLKRTLRVVRCPTQVAQHAFYPLIRYQVTSKKVRKDSSGKLEVREKLRPIAYAAHLDSQIYSYFAHQLSVLYEAALIQRGLDSCVLAFRPLGLSNVDFAALAFAEIAARRRASAVALDISKFFDTLDHGQLKASWCDLLGTQQLPPDHYNVYRSLTEFATVDRDALYAEFGISPNNARAHGRRICSPEDFRNKVRGRGLISTNKGPGIPQGTPISAILSNIYMLGFDSAAKRAVEKIGGAYYRYCDDMLFIVPPSLRNRLAGFARKNIKQLNLDINPDKTEIRTFHRAHGLLTCDKPLQYLGFTFDGQRILLRSAALARFSDRMKRGVRLAKATMKKRNKLKLERGEDVKDLFRKKLYQRYSHLGRRNFIRYGHRAANSMKSEAIRKQLKPLWERLLKEIDSE